ncbi:hypothetical protein L289_2633 [Acinetobacter gerneri DSM 14967 = CIP 107464 = MTCC 9824]|uniref:DUF559 domain-containing protein n=2 Tax=Acinetobacter gerneri TaxID=202952 RepID=N8ZLD4_9GAMM|nr:hypothetical protein [Acinetobacter gerneri]ENV34539.1 hypothetical protein F960_01277 [Acinetobacter gerneri DSM 14967 = CIP 107464 = MTCC 9824]EPR82908.1 hypothetical protein L289_2633 [Acinetobacter gerneri DSM 14967 = CIP 107464 = MTCC 9824]
MEIDQYKQLTKKSEIRRKPRTKPLPKATEKYLEAEETLFQELEENLIGYRRKFQFESTRNWRFDFYIVKLNLLIEIVGSPWAVGRGGKKIANSFNKYDLAEDMGYKIERFHPDSILSGHVINWIKEQLESSENGTDQTISTNRLDRSS